jgi:leucyl/phenylalanyl-tRNA---protein transferase
MRPDPQPAISPETLLRAYAMGIFPMAEGRNDPTIHWVDPRQRGIMPMDGPHISRSLARRIHRGGFRITANVDFAGVLAGCADRDETWINAEIAQLYQGLHRSGHAHSLEVWDQDRLIGGVYGVALGQAFFGESMFSRSIDASKIALVYLLDRLRAGGFTLFDTQFLTPHLATLGGIEVPRAQYHALLARALTGTATFDPPGYAPPQSIGASGSIGASSTSSDGASSVTTRGSADSGTRHRKGQTS